MVDNEEREWMTVKSFHERHPEVGGRNFIYEKARTGELASIRLGSRILIASDALDQLAQQKRIAPHEPTSEST